MKIKAPPIKSQGIKTKLVPWIRSVVPESFSGIWIEPFVGTGAVVFNILPEKAILCDTNPHIIKFYNSIASNELSPSVVREYLSKEGSLLETKGEQHYYDIRARFNETQSSLDFLFLNRAGFNGMIRFNKSGKFNTPFCRKIARFSPSYITRITNQVKHVSKILKENDYVFQCLSFEKTIPLATVDDIVYCDPPYIDRHADYYNGWGETDEKMLYQLLSDSPSKFILSTWHHNDYRENIYIDTLWKKFKIMTKEHFYHLGAKEQNRNPMVEALITNYSPNIIDIDKKVFMENFPLFALNANRNLV